MLLRCNGDLTFTKLEITAITSKLGERLSISPKDVFIIMHEPPLENWGLGGRQMSEGR